MTTTRRRTGAARRRKKQREQKKSLWKQFNESSLFSKKKPKKTEVVSVTRELATLLESGIGMSAALHLLGDQRKGTMLGDAILALAIDLNAGATIAESMAHHPDVFPRIYVRTVSAADKGAPLPASLRQAADFLDTAASAIAQAKRALIYPGLIMMVGVVVVLFLVTVSLPQMINLFSTLGADLPLPTKILIGLSEVLRAYPIFIVGGLIALVAAVLKFKSTTRGKYMIHQWMLHLPLFKNVIISSDLARTAGALSALTEVGMPVPDALEVALETVGNDVIRAALVKARQGLIAGEGLADPLAESGIFPATFVQTLKVAENTGTLDANLKRMSEFYQNDAEEKVKAMVAVIEPLSTVIVALLVGFVALSVIMPMYTILGAIDN